jgi:LysR family transcriptional regulator, nod-box dependent transcriptional activator
MRFHGLNLNLLAVMDALLDEGSVSSTALRLNLSQPAISNALAQLREHYDDKLFVTVGGRMLPTELTLRLAAPIRDILRQSQAVIQERSAFDPLTAERRFFVAVSDYEGSAFMPAVTRHLARLAPGISVSLRLTISPTQLSLPQVTNILDHRQNDFVVLPASLASESHPREWLYDEHYVVVAWDGNRLIGDELGIDEYLALSHVVAEFADSRSQGFEGQALTALGYVRKVGTAVEHFTLIPEFVVGTDQIATVHAELARLFVTRFPLKTYPIPIALPPLPIVAQWNRVRELDPGVRWFAAQLMEVARSFRSAAGPRL